MKLTLFAAVMASALLASATDDNFAKAQSAYTEGNYNLAEELYSKAASESGDPAARYNLGNVLYKQGKLGEAILEYRRAEVMTPRDQDLKSNLNRALSQTGDQLVLKSLPQALKSFLFPYYYLGLREQTAISLLFWALAWLALTFVLVLKAKANVSGLKKAAIACFVLALGMAAIAATRYCNAARHGVVTAELAEVLAGPDHSYTKIFELHDGAEARIVETVGGWKKISVILKEGQTQSGWLPASQIKSAM